LYIYFKNKKEIFNYSIKLLLVKVEEGILRVRTNASLNSIEKITEILSDILRQLEENSRLLSVTLDYLLHLSKSAVDPELRVRRRTLRLRHFLASIVIEGVKAGEIAPVNIKIADDFLYSFIEAAIFRLVVLKRDTVGGIKDSVAMAVSKLAVVRAGPGKK
jgi:AcrR family transcriptional regulator